MENSTKELQQCCKLCGELCDFMLLVNTSECNIWYDPSYLFSYSLYVLSGSTFSTRSSDPCSPRPTQDWSLYKAFCRTYRCSFNLWYRQNKGAVRPLPFPMTIFENTCIGFAASRFTGLRYTRRNAASTRVGGCNIDGVDLAPLYH